MNWQSVETAKHLLDNRIRHHLDWIKYKKPSKKRVNFHLEEIHKLRYILYVIKGMEKTIETKVGRETR